MESQYDLFTKIFLDTYSEKTAVLETVSKIVKGSVTGSTIETDQAGYKAIASCDFEDELPRNGGSG